MSLSTKYSFLSVVLAVFCLIPSHCSAGKVIFLNGTSSAGKSSIAQMLKQKLTTSKVTIVSYDNILFDTLKKVALEKKFDVGAIQGFKELQETLHENAINPEELAQRVDEALFELVKHRACYDDYVILDAVTEDENEFKVFKEKTSNFDLLHVLVYCGPKKLVEHVFQRNKSNNKDEHRSAVGCLVQFYSMYQPCSENELCIDTIQTKELRMLVNKELKTAQPPLEEEEIFKAEMDVVQKFKLDVQDTVVIKPFFLYDAIVNTGISSSQACAQQIIEKLSL